MFTLNVYSIPGSTVPADTVKFPDGVTFVFMSSIVSVSPVSVTQSKSAYFMSHTISVHLKFSGSMYHKPCPGCGVFDVFTLCGFSLVYMVLYFYM